MKPYHHGMVHRSLLRGARDSAVELTIATMRIKDGNWFEESTDFLLTAGEARSLARHLSLFADVVDGCTGDTNETLNRRVDELAKERAAATA